MGMVSQAVTRRCYVKLSCEPVTQVLNCRSLFSDEKGNKVAISRELAPPYYRISRERIPVYTGSQRVVRRAAIHIYTFFKGPIVLQSVKLRRRPAKNQYWLCEAHSWLSASFVVTTIQDESRIPSEIERHSVDRTSIELQSAVILK